MANPKIPHERIKQDRAAAQAATSTKSPEQEALDKTIERVESAREGLSEFGLSNLGRVRQDRTTARAREEVLSRLLEESKGLSSREMGAQRAQFSQRIGRATQQAQRQLASQQARQGLRGGIAASQQAGVLQAGIQAQSEAEAGLIQADRAARLQGLQLAEAAARGQQQDSLQVQRINLQQAMREKMAELTGALGLANIAETNRLAQEAIIARTNVPAPSSGGGVEELSPAYQVYKKAKEWWDK